MKRVFVDTNIWLYTHDFKEPHKQEMALKAVTDLRNMAEIVVSNQVIAEFSANLVRRFHRAPTEVVKLIQVFRPVTISAMYLEDFEYALKLMQSISISFWDAMILSTAIRSRCDEIITEDFQAGQVVQGVRFTNPFTAA